MKPQLITLAGVSYDNEAYSVQLPTVTGMITVLQGHEPLMSVLKPGVITIKPDARSAGDTVEHYATYGGVLEVTADGPRVLVDEADSADGINTAEAEKARDQALQLLKNAKNQVELEQAQALVDRSAVRLQVAGLRRRNRR